MGMIYQWKNGHFRTDAQVAGEELERIRTRNNGRLDAEGVVEASRPEDAVLHGEFEWDDKIAAERWRQDQASYIIRHIGVLVSEADDATPVRAFVSVKRDEDRSYTSVQHALSDDELRAQVLNQAWVELEAWRRRHAELIELAKVFAVIDEARAA
jgi:hypothetical protein